MSEVLNTVNGIESLVREYLSEEEKFTGGNKTAGTRARKLLSEIGKLTKQRRAEIQEIKNNA